MLRTLLFASAVCLLAAPQSPAQPTPWSATGKKGAVAAGGQAAVDAGIEVLQQGGNAADAGVATILAMTVTDSRLFCFGGEAPILVYDAKRRVVEAISGMGAAPRLATREHFGKKGGIPARGVEAAAVPAVLDACLTVLDRHGTCTFAAVAAPTLRLLDKKQQPWHADLAATLRTLIAAEKRAAGDRRRGLRLVADCFYRGPIARAIDEWSRANGGLLRYTDLATHATRVEEPASVDYRGYTVYKCGPWTQGPALLQTLGLLGGFDLRASGHNKPDTVHLCIEALKLALADRDVHYADPLFTSVPLDGLLAPKYTDLRRRLIDPKKASLTRQPGDPVKVAALLEKFDTRVGVAARPRDTTTCIVADAQGNMLASTPSGFAGVVAGKTGVWLGSRLQSFNTWEGHGNCIEPGKRPRITLTPTLVLKDGKPAMAVSVAGGDMQEQATLQLLTGLIDFGLTPAQVVTAPRFGTNHLVSSFRQAPPRLGSLLLDPRLGDDVRKALAARGHTVTARRPAEAPVVIRFHATTGTIEVAGDPRARRHARAY